MNNKAQDSTNYVGDQMIQSPLKINHLNFIVNRIISSSYEKVDSLISFLQSSSLFTAINGFLRTYYSFLLFGALINWDLLLATFLIVFAVYCMNNLIDKDDDEVNSPEKANFVRQNKKILGVAVTLSYITTIVLGILESIIAVFILFFPLFAGFVYSIKISSRIPRLKDIFGVKSLTVALSWAVGTTFIPSLGLNNISIIFIISIFYFFFVKSFVTTVLLDIRDIKGDAENGIKTIPVGLGKSKTQRLLTVVTLSLIPVIFILLIYGLPIALFITMAFSMANSYWYIHYICNNENIHKHVIQLLVHGEWFFVLALCFITRAV